MARKKEGYLSAKESRRISKENRKVTNAYEKARKRKNVPESEYLTQMRDPSNSVEFDNLHTYFFTDAGTVKAVDGTKRELIFLAENGHSDGKRIDINDIADIRSRIMEYLDD